jgi:protein-disulfide isomerase
MNTALNVLTVACTLAAAVVVAHIYWKRANAPTSGGELRPTTVTEWRSYAREGHRSGSRSAPVVVTVFSDFECPFCRTAARDIRELRGNYGTKLAVVYRHYPLEFHPHAHDAALASECAAQQGTFDGYAERLFAKQDSLGLIPWSSIALDVGVPDMARFATCMKDSSGANTILRDVMEAKRLGVNGTPARVSPKAS